VRAHKQVLRVKQSMHFIMHSSTRPFITMSISIVPKGVIHYKSVP